MSVANLSVLKGLAEKQFAYGGYFSSVYEGLTVGAGVFPFRDGLSRKTTVFIALKPEKEALEFLKEKKEEFKLPYVISSSPLYTSDGDVKGSFYLLKAEFDGIVLKDFGIDRIAPYVELKKALKDYLFQYETDYTLVSGYPDEYETDKKWIKGLINLAGKYPLKAVVFLDKYFTYSLVVNSLFSYDPEKEPPYKVFVGMRKKLLREYLPPEDLEVRIPSDGFFEDGTKVIVPMIYRTYDEAVKDLKRAKVVVRKDSLPEP